MRVLQSSSPIFLLSVGTFLGSFSSCVDAYGIGTSHSRLHLPQEDANKGRKDNGAEYATHRPYKVDFDLLQVSDRSQELGMPMVGNNAILDESKESTYVFGLDPTLRSRRRKRSQVESQQVISANSPDFQNFNLCLPYLNTNPLCRQIVFGLMNRDSGPNAAQQSNLFVQNGNSHGSASAVSSSASPSVFYVPSAFSPSSSISSFSSNSAPVVAAGPMISRTDLAILNYYQQQQFPSQQQPTFQQVGLFQAPLPLQRQEPLYDGIHTKYPYPYPPTELDVPQTPQAIVPESGATGEENAQEVGTNEVNTENPPDLSQTTASQVPVVEQQSNSQQDADIPAIPAGFPASAVAQQEEENTSANSPTTYNPADMTSSSPLPPSQPIDVSTQPPVQEESPPQGGAPSPGFVPVSPHINVPSEFQPAPAAVPLPVQAAQPPAADIAVDYTVYKRLQEKDEEIKMLKSHLDEANLQLVAYEKESTMVKEQFVRSEEANLKLRDRVLQLENTNQHLQEKNGQLQQVNTEQHQQINALKVSAKDAKDQLDAYQTQVNPLSEEVLKHRKEMEDFLIRIRKLGEENETCKKQVRLYQLKVNYIMEQQRQQQQQSSQQVKPQKKKQPVSTLVQQQQPSAADLTVHDDELDPELSRMDAEIAALQKSAEEVSTAIQKLPPTPEKTSLVGETLPLPDSSGPVVAAKKENEFPGEAVQVDPEQTKHKNKDQEQKIATAADVARAESVLRTIPGSAPAWELPAGF